MDPRVEEILMARAMMDAEDSPTVADAAMLGAGLGAVGGIGAGQVVRSANQVLSAPINALAARQGLTPAPVNRLKAGPRMAGGLVGLILGGGLGAGIQAAATQNSPAARLLAKAQAQGGELSPDDKRQLADVLESTYAEMGLR